MHHLRRVHDRRCLHVALLIGLLLTASCHCSDDEPIEVETEIARMHTPSAGCNLCLSLPRAHELEQAAL